MQKTKGYILTLGERETVLFFDESIGHDLSMNQFVKQCIHTIIDNNIDIVLKKYRVGITDEKNQTDGYIPYSGSTASKPAKKVKTMLRFTVEEHERFFKEADERGLSFNKFAIQCVRTVIINNLDLVIKKRG